MYSLRLPISIRPPEQARESWSGATRQLLLSRLQQLPKTSCMYCFPLEPAALVGCKRGALGSNLTPLLGGVYQIRACNISQTAKGRVSPATQTDPTGGSQIKRRKGMNSRVVPGDNGLGLSFPQEVDCGPGSML